MVEEFEEVKIKKRSLPTKYDDERRLFIRTIEDWGAWAELTQEEVYEAVDAIVAAKTQYEARYVFNSLRVKIYGRKVQEKLEEMSA